MCVVLFAYAVGVGAVVCPEVGTESACTRNVECAWRGKCEGVCDGVEMGACRAHDQCLWQTSTELCIMSEDPLVMSAQADESPCSGLLSAACETTSGCAWSDTSNGCAASADCNHFALDDCSDLASCEWSVPDDLCIFLTNSTSAPPTSPPTPVPTPAPQKVVDVSLCGHNGDCRTYGDQEAVCSNTTNACECKEATSTDLCTNGRQATEAVFVTYLFVFEVACELFFDDSYLMNRFRTVLLQLMTEVYAVNVQPNDANDEPSISFGCGSLVVVVKHFITSENVTAYLNAANTALGNITEATALEGTHSTTSVLVNKNALLSSPLWLCPQAEHPVTQTLYVKKDTCITTDCASGYSLQRDSASALVCLDSEEEEGGDSDIAGGTIAIIVVGLLMVCGVVLTTIAVCKSDKKLDTNEPVGHNMTQTRDEVEMDLTAMDHTGMEHSTATPSLSDDSHRMDSHNIL